MIFITHNSAAVIFKKILIPSLLLLVVFYFIMPVKCFDFDLNAFKSWFDHINVWGLGNIYYCEGANYPPGYYYILKLHGILAGTEMDFAQFIKGLKMYSLIFDLAGIIVVLIAVEKNDRLFLHWALLALNISFLYNSVLWGQIDGITSMLNFSTVYCFYKKKTIFGIVLYVISLNIKLQGIIFFPILFLILLADIRKSTFRKMLFYFSIIIFTQLIILIPFLHLGKLKQILNVVNHAVDYWPMVSCNAANVWYWLFPANTYLFSVSDKLLFAGNSLRNWGFVLTAIIAFIAMYPLIKSVYNYIKMKMDFIEIDLFLLGSSLLPLILFYFSTQMHERYSHNSWLFIAAWSFRNKNYIPLILFSCAYLSNMESLLQFLQLNNYNSIVWNMRFASTLYGLLIMYLIFQLYKFTPLFRKVTKYIVPAKV